MEMVLKSPNLARRAFWLIKLRWLATLLLVGATFVASNVLGIKLQQGALFFGTGDDTLGFQSMEETGNILISLLDEDALLIKEVAFQLFLKLLFDVESP